MRGRRIGRRPVAALALAGLAVALAAGGGGARAKDRARVAVGERPPADLVLQAPGAQDDAGLAEVAGLPAASGARPVVLLWWSIRCPVCARYAETVRTLAADLGDEADVVLVLTPDDGTAEDLARTLDEQGLAHLGAWRDPRGAAARLAVRVSPAAVVLDAEGHVRYRGPIDDDRRARGKDTRALLLPAVRAVLAGREVEPAEARAFGSALRVSSGAGDGGR